MGLSAFVVFCTTYALILPALTLSVNANTYCNKEEHIHTAECYTSTQPLCGLEEGTPTGHTHGPECYETQQELICSEFEDGETHIHDGNCYQDVQVLTCNQEENSGLQVHVHDESCYHSDTPLCGKEEHTHSRQCESNPEAVETEEDWKDSLPKELSKDKNEAVLQIAKSQLKYKESVDNFLIKTVKVKEKVDKKKETSDKNEFESESGLLSNQNETEVENQETSEKNDLDAENDKASEKSEFEAEEEETPESNEIEVEKEVTVEKGYTRYGDWTDDRYGDWNNAFVGWVLKQANVNADFDKDIGLWISTLQESEDHKMTTNPTKGNVVFYRDEGAVLHTAIVSDLPHLIDFDKDHIKVIEGDVDDEVKEVKVEKDLVLGYLDFKNDANEFDSTESSKNSEESKADSTDKDENTSDSTPSETTDGSESKGLDLANTGNFKDSDDKPEEGSAEGSKDSAESSDKQNDQSHPAKDETDSNNDNRDSTDQSKDSSIVSQNSSTNKTVSIDGKRNVVTGDEVVLRSRLNNIDPTEVFSYQWQYQANDNEGWFNVEGGDEDTLLVVVDDDNLDYTYRVIVNLKESSSNVAGTPAGSYKKLVPSIKMILPELENQAIENDETEDGDGIQTNEDSSNQSGSKVNRIISDDFNFGVNSLVTDTYSSTAQTPNDNEPWAATPVSKQIDSLNDENTNEYTYSGANDLVNKYRLYLSAGPIAGQAAESPINVLFILDTSGSMAQGGKLEYIDGVWKMVRPYEKANRAIAELSDAIMNLNSENQIALVTFARHAAVEREWQPAPLTSDKLPNNPNDGTNYTDALNIGDEVLGKLQNSYKTFVIFLSDGEPTFYNKRDGTIGGEGSSTDDETASATTKAISDFKDNHQSITIAAINYKNGADNTYLKQLATDDKYLNTDTTQIVNEMKQLILGPKLTKGRIIDKLSKYVDFDENLHVKVVAQKKQSADKPIILFEQNKNIQIQLPKTDKSQGNNDKEYWEGNDIFNTPNKPFNIDNSNKKITLEFKDNWEMDPGYEYILSFNVKVNSTAYTAYATSGYPDQGEDETDYKDNKTSSKKDGFFSNDQTETKFQFMYGKDTEQEEKYLPYPMPVVQVNQQILLRKYALQEPSEEKNEVNLSGAKFKLYKRNGENARVQIGEEYVTDTQGMVTLPILEPGTYFLEEVDPPEGYLKTAKDWEIVVQGIKEQPKITVNGDLIAIDDQSSPQKKESSGEIVPNIENPIAYQYKVKVENKPGKRLPETGGSGTYLMTFGGSIAIFGSLLMYGYSKRLDIKKKGGN